MHDMSIMCLYDAACHSPIELRHSPAHGSVVIEKSILNGAKDCLPDITGTMKSRVRGLRVAQLSQLMRGIAS